jgi:PEP-CTERM motif
MFFHVVRRPNRLAVAPASKLVLFREPLMTSFQSVRKLSLGIFVVVAVVSCCHMSAAAPITVEPDTYPHGLDINTIDPGVLLRVYNATAGIAEPPALSAIEALNDFHVSTGARVFGHNGLAFFFDLRQLDMTFAAPTDFVSIDFIGSSTALAEVGILEIYDSLGTLLDTYTTDPLMADEIETMSFTRTLADVKIARAYTATGSVPFGRLDNLSYNQYAVVPEPATFCLIGVAAAIACVRRRRAR